MDAERFTRLDRLLIAAQERDEFSDLRPDKDMLETARQNRALLIDRARKLERMGLATEHTPGIWTISPRAEPMLRELGVQGDIIKTMHQALERDGLAERRSVASYALHRDRPNERIVGRVVAKGLGGDELGERIALTIDGVDGRVHHIEVPANNAEDIGAEASSRSSRPQAFRAPPIAISSRRPMRTAFTARQRIVSGRSRGSGPRTPMSMSAAMSAVWRRCAAPDPSSASIRNTGLSPLTCPNAALPMIASGSAMARVSTSCPTCRSTGGLSARARLGSTAPCSARARPCLRQALAATCVPLGTPANRRSLTWAMPATLAVADSARRMT